MPTEDGLDDNDRFPEYFFLNQRPNRASKMAQLVEDKAWRNF
jgi:hypothetical protein